MHYSLSVNTAKDFGISQFTPTLNEHDEFSEHWYVHRVLIERRMWPHRHGGPYALCADIVRSYKAGAEQIPGIVRR